MSKLGVALIHGMGSHGVDFADNCIQELENRLESAGKRPQDVSWKPINWGALLDGRENQLWRKLSQGHDLDFARIRREIVISGLGDAVAYLGPAFQNSAYYKPIHEHIAAELNELREELEKQDKAPLIVFAHSLGCAIVSNYIWDVQQAKSVPDNATTGFARAETLSGILTFGCNIPIFTLARPLGQIKTIKFPGSKAKHCFPGTTASARKKALQWNNYFDADDVLGYPLKPINAAYDKVVNEDIQIQTGTILGAHSGYWTDNNFTRPAARQLAGVLDLLGA